MHNIDYLFRGLVLLTACGVGLLLIDFAIEWIIISIEMRKTKNNVNKHGGVDRMQHELETLIKANEFRANNIV
jgi:hypothetical protein